MTIYLYTRVSTEKQSVDAQEQELLKRYPSGTVIRETASGVKARPELEKLLQAAQPGDTIAVAALDRLGRKLSDILLRLEDLHKRGVIVISLRESVDYSTAAGKFMVHAFCIMAELERGLISERTRLALQAKKAAGKKLGARPKYGSELVAKAVDLRSKKLGLKEISKETGISMSRLSELFVERRLSA